MQSGRNGTARQVAAGGVTAALSLAVLALATASPAARLGLTAAAGLFPAAAVVSGGLWTGAGCYAASALLGLVLLPQKDCAICYTLLFGIYPLVKSLLERLRRPVFQWLGKLLFFNGALSVLMLGFGALLMGVLPKGVPVWALYLAGNGAFAVYDVGFSKLITFYVRRVHRVVSG